ncbi:MAG: hypothetical protein Q9187_008890 [Circinaria calcarea]
MGIASLRLKEAGQGKRSVRELASYIESLEEDIPEQTREEQRAWVLLNALKSELRSAVLREERTIESRQQVITSAQRQHELEALTKPRERDARETRDKSERGAETSQDASKRREGSDRGPHCYQCGKEGHIARRCPQATGAAATARNAETVPRI